MKDTWTMTFSIKLRTFIRKNISLVFFLVAAFGFRWSVADQYYIPSGSMEPTLAVGDRVLVNKMAYELKIPYTHLIMNRASEPLRGDIVVFENPRDGVTMIKRIIGLPSDHIVVDDGFVKINGAEIVGTSDGVKNFENTDRTSFIYSEKFGEKNVTVQRLPFASRPHHIELTVPENSFFAMGDNRDNSSDSRVWGFIPRENLKGRAFAVFWSMKFEGYLPKFDFHRTALSLN